MKYSLFMLLAVWSVLASGCRQEADLTEPRDQKQITDLVNRLFMYTDDQNWLGLQAEVFTPNVRFDMSSAGAGPPRTITALELTRTWDQGFEGLDQVHHQAGHYLITVNGDQADVYAYSVATHYRAAATRGNTRTIVGSYDLIAERTTNGWRLSQFKYNLKYMDGNLTME